MKSKITSAIAWIVAITTFTCLTPLSGQVTGASKTEQQAALDLARIVFPEVGSVSSTNTVWYVVKNKSGNILGYLISSKPYTKDIIGDKGPTPVVLFLDKNKHIIKLHLLENNESQGYISKLTSGGFLNSWNGKTLKEASMMNVDAVSGATLSSQAISKNVSVIATKALEAK